MLIVSLMLSTQTVITKYIFEHISWVSCLLYTMIFTTIMSWMFLLRSSVRNDALSKWPVYKKNFPMFLLNEVLVY